MSEVLGSGVRVGVIGPGDKEALAEAFGRLSPESRYMRFFSPRARLSQSDLKYLTEVDHYDHEALVARDDGGAIVAVARYVRTDPPEQAEVAVVVGDAWQGRGIASGLLARLVGRARLAGITHFQALILGENAGAIELFSELGESAPRRRTVSGGHVELLIELPDESLRGTALGAALKEAATGEHQILPPSAFAPGDQR